MSVALDRFQNLLLWHSQETDPAIRQLLEADLWREFGADRAVLVFDMAGFSEMTLRYGIVHYLSMVLRMQTTAEPVIRRYNGALVKFEGDNCYAVFPGVTGAIHAALELNTAFKHANELTPDELDIRIACGIDYGPILVVPGQNFYGNAINRALRFGEELAGPDEILVTVEAMATIPEGTDIGFTMTQFESFGSRIDAGLVTAASG